MRRTVRSVDWHFGFSRGAFTARSFVGFIRHAGILDAIAAAKIDEAIRIYREAPAGKTGEESDEGLEFRKDYCSTSCVSDADQEYRIANVKDFDPVKAPVISIRFVGVWDTVRALGAPDFVPFSKWINRKFGYHDAVLTSKVAAARHAVALDERRSAFGPTLFGRDKIDDLNARKAEGRPNPFEPWELPYQEQWFPGVHGAIGGGGIRRGLSDAALQWVLNGAQRAGLDLRDAAGAVTFSVRPDAFDDIFNDKPSLFKRLQGAIHDLFRMARSGPVDADEISLTTFQRWTGGDLGRAPRYRPRSLRNAGVVLSRLAADRLGDPKRWPELFEINRDRLDDPEILPIGLKIRLPRKADGEQATSR